MKHRKAQIFFAADKETPAVAPAPSTDPNEVDVAEVPVDFSQIGQVINEPKEAPKAKEPAKAAEKKPEAAPEAKESQGEAKKEPVEQPKKEPEAKKTEEPAKAKVEEPKKAEKPKVTIPDNNDDIDKIEARPGTHPKFQNDIKALKDHVKNARAEYLEAQRLITEREQALEALKKEHEELSKKSLTPETEKELADLRALRLRIDTEHDPEFQKEFTTKIASVDDNLFNLLTGPGLLMDREPSEENPEFNAKFIRDNINKYDRTWWEENVVDRIKSKILQGKVINMLNQRDAVLEEKQQKLQEYAKDGSKLIAERGEREKQTAQQWGAEAGKHARELTSKHDWAILKDVPENASAEDKKLIEAHNESVKELAKEAQERVAACYTRDPRKLMEVVVKSLNADQLEKVNAQLAKETKEKDARIAELEETIAKRNRSGRISELNTQSAAKNKGDDSTAGQRDKTTGEVAPDFSKIGQR